MVRRAHDIYRHVWSFENLVRAERAAARGKRGRPDVAAFEYYLEDELVRLQEELSSHTYEPGQYQRHIVREPKQRVIAAAPYRDRVVHHALCRVIEPLFERQFIADSFASRLGKGTHAAVDRCSQFARRFRYVLRCDIVQFFPSVNHDVLRDRLARVIGDTDVLCLCDRILEGGIDQAAQELTKPPRSNGGAAGDLTLFRSHAFEHDNVPGSTMSCGLPIGNQTSQFWANVYLDGLDQFVKRELRCRGYVRYVDDFVLFSDDKRTLHQWKQAIIRYLASVHLALHERESTVFPVRSGIPFLGFRVFPDHRRLRRRNVVAFAHQHRRSGLAYACGDLSFEKLTARVQGWVAHAAHGDTYLLRQSLLSLPIGAPVCRTWTPQPGRFELSCAWE